MNRSKFNQTGGYPLKTERLQEQETAYSIFNAFGSLAGDLTIVEGCETIGTTVQNGKVFIAGELFDFKSAAVTPTSKVIIIETPVNASFKNGVVKEVYTIRYATFGTAETSWPWINFKRPVQTKTIPQDLETRLNLVEKKLAIFQPGGVVFPWFKPVADIPAGFQEVDDMAGRTIIGYDPTQTEFNAIGKPGGAKNKTLSISEIPAHSHGYKKAKTGRGYDFQDRDPPLGSLEDAETDSVGGGQAFSILNPYRVAAYIEFIG